MNKYRLGVVGCGHRGRFMFQCAAKNCKEIEPVAACDIKRNLWYDDIERYNSKDPSMAKQMPTVQFYEDYDEMLDKANLDIVLVDTPATCHASFCAKALKRNIHVLSDIPTVSNLEEAAMIWDVAGKSSAMMMIGATTMAWGFVLALQDLVKKGLLGKPYAMEAEYIHDCRYLWEETPWRKPGEKWCNMPVSYCTHSLGPLLSIIDEDLDTAYAVSSGSNVTDLPFANDYMTALYQTKSGVTIRTTLSFINNCKYGNHSFRVYGSEGHFEHLSSRGPKQDARTTFNSTKLLGTSEVTELPVSFSPFIGPYKAKYRNLPATDGHGGADCFLWLQFIEALNRGDKQAPITLRQGLCMTLPGIYARESVYRGGVKMQIHYPWQKEFQNDIDTFYPVWAKASQNKQASI